jgi:peptidoglycan/LPS O-acetylase OafA/YrhL
VFHKPLHDFVGVPLLERMGIDMTHAVGATIAYIACGLAVAFVAAVTSYYLIERHFLRLKRFFVPRSAGAPLPDGRLIGGPAGQEPS